MQTINGNIFDRMSLSDIIDRGDELVFKCSHCGNSHRLDPVSLASLHGGATLISFIRRNYICSLCGHRAGSHG